MKQSAPVIKHREWRFLVRDFIAAHPKFCPFHSKLMQFTLAPAAAAAWWLLSKHPDLLERDALHLVIPGASTMESIDEGRWFAFLPWLLNRPSIRASVTLVGDEVRTQRHSRGDAGDLSLRSRENTTLANQVMGSFPPSAIFEGKLAQWLVGPGATVSADAYVLFSPGIGMHYKSWFGEDGLVSVLKQRLPTALFGYSKLDSMEDLEVLQLLGFELASSVLVPCPWYLKHEYSDAIGGFGQYCLDLRATVVPDTINLEGDAMRDFADLQNYGLHDFESYGADQAMERLGRRVPVRIDETGRDDAIIILPYEQGILESTRELGRLDETGFTSFKPSIIVPADKLAEKPGDDRLVARYIWALRLHRDWVAPAVAEAGARAPTHPSWWDVLELTLGWDLKDYDDDCERLAPAFWAPAPMHGVTLPVVCEAYAYFPDNVENKLANETMEILAGEYPSGVLLLFKAMPYTEIAGHKYHFGGMLFWEDEWRPFAMNEHLTSADDVITQIESGFTFETPNAKYADDRCRLTIPFNRMCYGLDPNGPTNIKELGNGKWVTLIPD